MYMCMCCIVMYRFTEQHLSYQAMADPTLPFPDLAFRPTHLVVNQKKTMPFLPPMTGNGNGDFSGELFFFPPHDDDLRVRNLSKVLKVRKQLQRLGDRGQAHIPSLSKVLRQFSDVVSPTEMPMTWKIYAFDDRKCDGKIKKLFQDFDI